MTVPTIDLRKVSVRPVVEPEEILKWNELIKEHHYLKSSSMVGEQIRYVAEHDGKWLALMGCSAATLKSTLRSKWIGWTRIQELQRLHLVIQNARFLILGESTVSNLASRCLSLLSKRVSRDWEITYGHPVYLMETFVDPELKGTCYKACGWENLGETAGFRREVGGYSRHGIKKSYWVYPLRKNGRELLGGDQTSDDRTLSSVPIAMLPLTKKNNAPSIQDILIKYFPRDNKRNRTGNPYPTDVIVGLVLVGFVSGVADSENIASWAKELDEKFKIDLNCPYREHNKVYGYQTPCANTIRYALQDINPIVLEEAMKEWTALCGINTDNTIIALDGKVLRGAITEDERAPTHVTLYDVASGIVLDQELVPNKTTEVTVARNLFDRNNLTGSLVTADAAHTIPATVDSILKKKGTTYSPSKAISLSFSMPWKLYSNLGNQDALMSPTTADMGGMKNEP